MIRIGHLLWKMPNAGLENLVCDLAGLQSEENQVWLIVINSKIDKNILTRLDGRINVLELNRHHKFCFNVFVLLRMILLRIDVIHIHDINLKIFRFLMPFVRKWYGTIHNTNIKGDCRGLHAISYVSKSIELEWQGRCSIDLLTAVIYNGVDIKKISSFYVPLENRTRYSLVQIGRIDFVQKGQDIALSALEELSDFYTLTFIGNGDDRRRLEELIVEKRLCKRVTIVENMPRHDLYGYLRTFQTCIMPSRFEGFGLVAIEAYLLGMKVVVSDVDGLREVSDIVGDIHLFQKNSSQSLAKAIKQAASLNEMNKGIDNFTLNLDICSKSHFQMYKTLCE